MILGLRPAAGDRAASTAASAAMLLMALREMVLALAAAREVAIPAALARGMAMRFSYHSLVVQEVPVLRGVPVEAERAERGRS